MCEPQTVTSSTITATKETVRQILLDYYRDSRTDTTSTATEIVRQRKHSPDIPVHE